MNVKPKKCKGTGKAIGHGCGKLNTYRAFGLGKECRCYQDWLLSSDEGKEYLDKITLKITAPRESLEKAEKQDKDRKKLSYLLVNVRNTCHEFIRLRDEYKPCISCGTPWNSNFQAGHCYKAEKYSNLKFDEKNINGQCKQCNLFKEGAESSYRAGLMQRFGAEHVAYLDAKAEHYKQNHYEWDIFELQELRKYYQEKLKELKNK